MTNIGNPQSVDDVPPFEVYDSDFRKCILQMHWAVTDLNLWSQVAHMNLWNSGVIWDHPYVDECGHSGATFALCLRIMQEISSIGWDAFVKSQNAKYPLGVTPTAQSPP